MDEGTHLCPPEILNPLDDEAMHDTSAGPGRIILSYGVALASLLIACSSATRTADNRWGDQFRRPDDKFVHVVHLSLRKEHHELGPVSQIPGIAQLGCEPFRR